ncbi:hypothetical protein ACJRO7_014373 [Eucalyptus globulus]|uniref:Uncharacterized protein n=1 Tax=Eucalyptus globulus TaxID=34317 RepID=A0ABD3L5Z4_EUCGL
MEFALRTCPPSPRSITRETLCGFVRDVEETSSPMCYRSSSWEMDFWASLDKAGCPGSSFGVDYAEATVEWLPYAIFGELGMTCCIIKLLLLLTLG